MNKSLSIVIFEWVGTFLLVAGITASIVGFRQRSLVLKIILIAVCAIVPLIPFGGLTIAEYVLTLVGHVSITSMVLLGVAVYRSFSARKIFDEQERVTLLVLVVVGGLIVFPESFGLDQFNGYQLGFGSIVFAIGLISLSLAFVLLRMFVAAAAIVLSVGAFELHFLLSNNLWDYLIDPLLEIYACLVLVLMVARRTFSKKGR